MKYFNILIITGLIFSSCSNQDQKTNDSFSFVFASDIHLGKIRHAEEAFYLAIDTINKMSPDFVLTGGDNIRDALRGTYEHCDSLYNLYIETTNRFNMPLYNTMGNHEVYGLSEGIDPSSKGFGKQMYEEKIGKRYYSFDHKNWHFIVLDNIGLDVEGKHYYGHFDKEQIEWLKIDLEKTGKKRPVCVSVHIPLLTILEKVLPHNTSLGNDAEVRNANEVIKLLEQYNTKLVLQGHWHYIEDIYYNGIHYVTGGAVCAAWWQGAYHGMEEGFLKIDVNDEDFKCNYIDFGWDAKNHRPIEDGKY